MKNLIHLDTKHFGFEPDTTGTGIPTVFENVQKHDLNLLIGNPEAKATLAMGWNAFNHQFLASPFKQIFFRNDKREVLFVRAIKNLRKKINFISLNSDFQNGDISDEEFEKEIELNPNKYVVNVEHIQSQEDLEVLYEVVERIEEDFTLDEIAEVFSIDISGINKIQKIN